MPVGSVTDPKMNPKEEAFGIMYVEGWGFCQYSKGNSASRAKPERFAVTGTKFNVSEPRLLNPPIFWNGIKVVLEVNVNSKIQDNEGPIERAFNKQAELILDKPNVTEMRNAIRTYLEGLNANTNVENFESAF